MSNLVLAKKWELLISTPVGDAKQGIRKYDRNGQKVLKHDKRLVDRDFAMTRNEIENNEYYELFEEETKELMKQRELNIQKQQEDKKKSELGMSDLIAALSGKVNIEQPKEVKPKPQPEKEVEKVKVEAVESVKEEIDFDSMNEDELKEYCNKKGIEFHHKAGKSKLLELINENK